MYRFSMFTLSSCACVVIAWGCHSLSAKRPGKVLADRPKSMASSQHYYTGRTLFRANPDDCEAIANGQYRACKFRRILDLTKLAPPPPERGDSGQQRLSLSFTFYCPNLNSAVIPIVYVKTPLAEIDYESNHEPQQLNFFVESQAMAIEFTAAWDREVIVGARCSLELNILQYLGVAG